MSKHHITIVMVSMAALYLVSSYIYVGEDLLSLLFLFLGFLIIILLGVLFPRINYFVYHENEGDNRTNEIALTFDDGPNAEFTIKVLEKLNKYNIPACFFIIGDNANKYPEIIKEINNTGHTLGNHSLHHKNRFPIESTEKIIEEIKTTNTIIKEITNKKMLYFRPPFGITNPRIARAINQSSMTAIGWNLRTYDTKNSAEKVIKKLKKKLKGGDIILLHDNHEGIFEIIDFIISHAQENGLKFVNMEHQIQKPAYES